jgi:hypothetical protein
MPHIDEEGAACSALAARSGMDDDRREARFDNRGAEHGLAGLQVLKVVTGCLDAADFAKCHRASANSRCVRQCPYSAGIFEIGNLPAAHRSPSDDLDLVAVVDKPKQFPMARMEIVNQLSYVALAGE